MEVLTETELRMRFDEIVDKIKNGAVFIHPTDTIYGLGCNALDEKAVEKTEMSVCNFRYFYAGIDGPDASSVWYVSRRH